MGTASHEEAKLTAESCIEVNEGRGGGGGERPQSGREPDLYFRK